MKKRKIKIFKICEDISNHEINIKFIFKRETFLPKFITDLFHINRYRKFKIRYSYYYADKFCSVHNDKKYYTLSYENACKVKDILENSFNVERYRGHRLEPVIVSDELKYFCKDCEGLSKSEYIDTEYYVDTLDAVKNKIDKIVSAYENKMDVVRTEQMFD